MSDSQHNPQTKVILVTGGAGFIGSNFIHYWLKNHPQDKIVNLDALTYAGNLANLKSVKTHPQYTFVAGDIRNQTLVNEIMPNIDIVVHFAAESHVDRSIKQPQLFLRTNILGTQVLLESALKHEVELFHHISTDEVFGSLSLNSSQKFSETTPYDPRSPYSASKAGSDHLVRAYGTTYDLNYTISNCSNNYGPYQFPEKFVALAITNLIDDQPIPLYGDGKHMRDWLYVKDHCRAIDDIINSGKTQETYLVGGLTQDVSNQKLAGMICDLMNQPHEMIEPVKDRPGHDRRYAVDWSKIKQELNWEPSVTLKDGLKQTIDWYRQHQDWWQELKQKNSDWFEEQYQESSSTPK